MRIDNVDALLEWIPREGLRLGQAHLVCLGLGEGDDSSFPWNCSLPELVDERTILIAVCCSPVQGVTYVCEKFCFSYLLNYRVLAMCTRDTQTRTIRRKVVRYSFAS
jgi:hypothetical protein